MGDARLKRYKKAFPKGIGDADAESIASKAGLPLAVAERIWKKENEQ